MGGTLAKFSVSALMFDYVLTGPISGVSAGQYLAGVLNELLAYAHIPVHLNVNATAAAVAIAITVYFWWENIKGVPESSEKALRIMQLTTVMVVMLIGWCVYTLLRARRAPAAVRRIPRNMKLDKGSLGWLDRYQWAAHDYADCDLRRPRPLRSGHERRRVPGAGLSRDRAPQTPEPEKGRAGYFHLQPGLHFAGFVLRRDDHSG